MDRWRSRITSVRWVPSLAGADRLQSAWVESFLLAPHDVRPGLVAEMPRLAITRVEAAQIAQYLTAQPSPASVLDAAGSHRPAGGLDAAGSHRPAGGLDAAGSHGGLDDGGSHRAPVARATAPTPPRDISRGEELFRSLACARCHRFTGSAVDDAALHAKGRSQVGPLDGAWALAPDLRHARTRMTTASMAGWIEHPRGAMPALGVNADSASVLAAFIASTPIADEAPRVVPARLPVLERPVTYAEVDKRVFKNVCWHCHAVPDFARGDGGPGNSGGFGFAPKGLDVSSYEGLASGALDERGERRSVFGKVDGTPRIVAHLMARYVEEAGGSVEGVRGMPLGLPPLPLEEIQLVESWIAQGRPR